MFSDQFLDKEENGKVFDVIIDYLTSEKVTLNNKGRPRVTMRYS